MSAAERLRLMWWNVVGRRLPRRARREGMTEAEYAALLPGRMQEIAAQLSEGLPEGMRFEWETPAPGKDACSRCGRDPAAGYAAGITGKRLCHPDPILHPDETGEDCYHITQGGKLHR